MISSPLQKFPDMTQASTPKRLSYIRSGAIFETEARLGFKSYLSDRLQKPSPSAENLIFLTAPSGMGVSTIVGEFAAQHPQTTDHDTGRPVVPVIREYVHPSGDIIDTCDEIRAKLAIPGYINMVRNIAYPKTLHLIGELKTQIVILEDFHRTHNFMKTQMVSYRSFVHHLISKYDICVVLTGAPNIWRWALDDEQALARSVHLQYHEWTHRDEDFIEFLQGFERWCPVQNGSSLARDTQL